MSENIEYYAFINKEKSPGLVKKVTNTVIALENLGYKSEYKIYDTWYAYCIDFSNGFSRDHEIASQAHQ
ncbi:MAG: hypothetical protein IE909_19105 [Campylobacterales bacterium]|nr:hypothetical protein [Campylobacterales bacterium]